MSVLSFFILVVSFTLLIMSGLLYFGLVRGEVSAYHNCNYFFVFASNTLCLICNVFYFFYYSLIALILGVLTVLSEFGFIGGVGVMLLLSITVVVSAYFLVGYVPSFKYFVVWLFLVVWIYGVNVMFFKHILPTSLSLNTDNLFLSLYDGNEYYLKPKGLLGPDSFIEYFSNNGNTGKPVVECDYELLPNCWPWGGAECLNEWNYAAWRVGDVGWYTLLLFLMAQPYAFLLASNIYGILFYPLTIPSDFVEVTGLLCGAGLLTSAVCNFCTIVWGPPEGLFLHSVEVSNECEVLVIYMRSLWLEFYYWGAEFENSCFIVHFFLLVLLALYLFLVINN